MGKIISLVICFVIIFAPLTVSATSNSKDNITISNEECLKIIKENTNIYKDDLAFARQVGNAGNCAMILVGYTVGNEIEHTYTFNGYNIITPGTLVLLYIYDGDTLYSMEQAVNNSIVTMNDIYYGFDHKGCVSLMKIEPTVDNPIERVEKSIDINSLTSYNLPLTNEDIKIINGEDTYFFKVRANKTGTLIFSSKGNGGKTYRYIYNEEMMLLAENDSEEYGSLLYEVEANKTYVLSVSMLTASRVGNISLKTMVFKLDFEPNKEYEAGVSNSKSVNPTITPETTVTEPASPSPSVTDMDVNKPAESSESVIISENPTDKLSKKQYSLNVNVKTKTIKAKKVKKEAQIVNPIAIKNAKGTVKVTKVKSGTTAKIYKKIKVNSRTGAITFKKGKYAKKTYKIRLKITVSGNST